jgi:hypothetical protein
MLYLQVAGVGIVIHLLMLLVFSGSSRQPVQEPAPLPAGQAAYAEPVRPAPEPAEPDAGFLSRLPPAIGRDLLCLQMQDHYVEAHTSEGSALLLMRFRDAVAELGGAGMQVHRSWWVAHRAVQALETDGRRAQLRLEGGRLIPVSRASLPEVRAALAERRQA